MRVPAGGKTVLSARLVTSKQQTESEKSKGTGRADETSSGNAPLLLVSFYFSVPVGGAVTLVTVSKQNTHTTHRRADFPLNES